MKTLAMPLSLLLLFPLPTLASSWQSSDTRVSDECSRLARACSGAAAELKAARNLIAGYESQIAAADARIDLAKKEIESLKQLGTLEAERGAKLEEVIAAEREAKEALIKIKEEQAARVASLEKKLSRSRRFALIAGVAAVIAIVIGIRK